MSHEGKAEDTSSEMPLKAAGGIAGLGAGITIGIKVGTRTGMLGGVIGGILGGILGGIAGVGVGTVIHHKREAICEGLEWVKKNFVELFVGEPQATRTAPHERPRADQPGAIIQEPTLTQEVHHYALCLVIPAREFEIVKELRKCAGKDSDIDEILAERLKGAAQWMWYGSVDSVEFNQLEKIVRNGSLQSDNSHLDLVVCLFFLDHASRDFKAGTIGRMYDGILGLSGHVKRVGVSVQLAGDVLGDLPLTRI
jgi:hypothetical protein